jgi:hypothetical protein
MSAVARAHRFSAEELAEIVSEQPNLFALPPVEDRAVAKAAAVFTGKITTRDDARCAEIARRYLCGESRREIAAAVGCSVNTIPVVIRSLEAAGKLETLKELVLRDLGEAVREQVAWNKELIEARKVSSEAAAILKAGWVGAGVYLDKVAGPQIHLHAHEHRVDAVGEDLAKRYAEQLRNLSSERESGAAALIANGLRGADTVDDTTSGAGQAGSGQLGAASADGLGVVIEVEACADTPGGGAPNAPGVPTTDGN